ncbi:hypothetical protein N0V88_003287 [Collariella sp. IMI 366227]|nr:hypothetical protein N0V88_003287 [Collariella sp. IMI 366227]
MAAARSVSVLKFVGTVSLGVLTVRPHHRRRPPHARPRLFSSSAFALAYALSPRPLRHPYLLYASALVLGSQLATSDLLAPYLLFLGPARSRKVAAAAAGKQKDGAGEACCGGGCEGAHGGEL